MVTVIKTHIHKGFLTSQDDVCTQMFEKCFTTAENSYTIYKACTNTIPHNHCFIQSGLCQLRTDLSEKNISSWNCNS